ncbi:MAG TPA: 30S ribosomal protein S20 [Anaerolineales bacterium]|nr:30S ribosomal protein S20 [Anaerolineales bacterium]
MANTASAIKRVRSNQRKRIRNRITRTGARTAVRGAREAIASARAEEARKATLAAISALDKAAEKGVIHKNNAARRKSRLMKKLAALDRK